MMSSRLLEYETIVRLNDRGQPPHALQIAQKILLNVQLIDLDDATLARALQPFHAPVRTLNAIHLATMVFLRGRGITLELATYDTRLGQAAMAIGFVLLPM